MAVDVERIVLLVNAAMQARSLTIAINGYLKVAG